MSDLLTRLSIDVRKISNRHSGSYLLNPLISKINYLTEPRGDYLYWNKHNNQYFTNTTDWQVEEDGLFDLQPNGIYNLSITYFAYCTPAQITDLYTKFDVKIEIVSGTCDYVLVDRVRRWNDSPYYVSAHNFYAIRTSGSAMQGQIYFGTPITPANYQVTVYSGLPWSQFYWTRMLDL